MHPLAILVLENNNYISYSINMDWSLYNENDAYNEFIERLYKHIQLDHNTNTCIHGIVHEVYVTFNDMPVNNRSDNIKFFVYNHEHCKNYKPVCNNMPIRFVDDLISDDCINYDVDASDSIITYNKVTCKHNIIAS